MQLRAISQSLYSSIIICFSFCLTSNLFCQDSSQTFAKTLRAYIGQKFHYSTKDAGTSEFMLKDVINDEIIFTGNEQNGIVVTLIRPVCYISKILVFHFPHEQKDCIELITFAGNENMEAVPWPPNDVSEDEKINVESAQVQQENKRALINDLNNLAANAYQYKIRPKSMGGGGGSYEGYSVPKPMSNNDNGTFSCMPQEDNLLFMAVSNMVSTNLIKVTLDLDGRLNHWQYFGGFKQ
jgi:hypothetical protein